MPLTIGTRIGKYEVVALLGAGGMGEVYRANDERLGRQVALKVLPAAVAADPQRLARFEREARTVAALNHPNIVVLYSVEVEGGTRFLTMELVEGDGLDRIVSHGGIPVARVVDVGIALADALAAAHERGVVHRDLKPGNVMVTREGRVKVLDFGLAKLERADAAHDKTRAITVTTPVSAAGQVLGTLPYMAPEQLRGETTDSRTDLFALGAILYELSSGQRPFGGASAADVTSAILRDAPARLEGFRPDVPPDLARVVERCLEKQPRARFQTASDVSHELQRVKRAIESAPLPAPAPPGATLTHVSGTAAESMWAGRVTRLIVLPFRTLRPDPETDFLAFSLPDAVTSALGVLRSLVVRSSIAAARFMGDSVDPRRVGIEADVDVILTGTLVRAGGEIRVATQLTDARSATLLWSHSSQAPVDDLFRVQDDLTHRIVASLSLPLSAREQSMLARDVPADARAYACFLRANQLSVDSKQWSAARDLYRESVEHDAGYAPAWARLGRMHHVMGKYLPAGTGESLLEAEAAYRRSLELNPDLTIAHKLLAQLEVDLGRAHDAMVRLVQRAQAADPELLAGLVTACRYCGLLDASLAAHARAIQLDPKIVTSVAHTWFVQGDHARVSNVRLAEAPYIVSIAMAEVGRVDAALPAIRELESGNTTRMRDFMGAARALLEGKEAESVAAVDRLVKSDFRDPEGLFYLSRHLAHLGERKPALELLERVVAGGFFCFPAMDRDPWLDALRPEPAFETLLRQAEARHRQARTEFDRLGGERILGASSQAPASALP